MQQEVLYIKLTKDVEVTQDKIFLKDLGTLYCKNDNIVSGAMRKWRDISKIW